MSAVNILGQIERLGVRVTAAGDKLILEPGSLVPADLLALVREHKAELLKMLSEAELAHRREVQEISAIMESQGWSLVWSDTLGETIAFANDDQAAAQVPAGIVTYTRRELEAVIGRGPDMLKLVHEGKKHGAKVRDRRG